MAKSFCFVLINIITFFSLQVVGFVVPTIKISPSPTLSRRTMAFDAGSFMVRNDRPALRHFEVVMQNSNDAGRGNLGKKQRVLFVCLGNICRSPAAEGVFQSVVKVTSEIPNH